MNQDWSFTDRLAADLSPDDFQLVLNLLRTDITKLMATIEAAARIGDQSSYRRAAHGLAGAAGGVGAEALERACRLAMTTEPGADLEAALPGMRAAAAAALVAITAAGTNLPRSNTA